MQIWPVSFRYSLPADNCISLQIWPVSFRYSLPADYCNIFLVFLQGIVHHNIFPTRFFSSQEVTCSETFPSIFFLDRKYLSENWSLYFLSSQKAFCRELFPSIFFPYRMDSFKKNCINYFLLHSKFPAENCSLQYFSLT